MGLLALVLLLLSVRARRQRLARVALEETDQAATGAQEHTSEQKLLDLSRKLALFAIIFGALNYATAGVVFGLTILTGGLGCVPRFRIWC